MSTAGTKSSRIHWFFGALIIVSSVALAGVTGALDFTFLATGGSKSDAVRDYFYVAYGLAGLGFVGGLVVLVRGERRASS